nr:hypothetical protein [Tanacetum cinerariifolium]
MTKVIKGEFEKLKDLKVEDVLLTCDTSLKVFNNEFNQMSRMDDDLFAYEVEIRGDDEVELTDEELSKNEDDVAEESHEITYYDHDEIKYENGTHDERQELCEAHELPVCNIRKFDMIEYSFRQDEEYVAVKEDEYDDLARTIDDACRAFQEIFRGMDEGWMVTRVE